MFNVYQQEQNKIEFTLDGELTEDEFIQIIHQLESLAAMYNDLYVLLDAARVKFTDFNPVLDQYDFYRKYKNRLKRVALVSDNRFQKFILQVFGKFSDTEFKTFSLDEIDSARKWIFPSRLP